MVVAYCKLRVCLLPSVTVNRNSSSLGVPTRLMMRQTKMVIRRTEWTSNIRLHEKQNLYLWSSFIICHSYVRTTLRRVAAYRGPEHFSDNVIKIPSFTQPVPSSATRKSCCPYNMAYLNKIIVLELRVAFAILCWGSSTRCLEGNAEKRKSE